MTDIENVGCAVGGLFQEPGPQATVSTAGSDAGHDDCLYLQEQVDQIMGVLVEHGYLSGAETPAAGVREMASDAAEVQRAREVLFSDVVLEEQYDVAGALREAIDAAVDLQQVFDLLCEHGVMYGGEPMQEVVETLLSTGAQMERARDHLIDDGRMDNDEDVPQAVQVLIAESANVRGVLVDSGYLSWEASPMEARALDGVVRDVVAEASALRQARRELVEVERQFIDMGERYHGERQYRVNVAAVARRVLLRAHAAAHAGPVATCATCARDLAVVGEASGVNAPGN